MVITQVPGGPHGSEFDMYLTTILSNICLHPKESNFNQINGFLMFFGGHKVAKILYIAIYIYSPIGTMVKPYSYHGEAL